MQFSVLFWNIWLENQINDRARLTATLDELKNIVAKFQPNVVGLNEVVKNTSQDAPDVLNQLRKLGYGNDHYAVNSNLSEKWLIGSTLSSNLPLIDVAEIKLGRDIDAERRGYTGCFTKGIRANIQLLNNKSVGIAVVHPHHLRHYTIREHYKATTTIKKLLSTPDFSSNAIIGGDFNEPGLFPHSFKSQMSDALNHKTGTARNTTWRWNGSKSTLIKANLDYIYWTKVGALKLVDFQVIDCEASDHKPVFATFEINDNG